MKTTHIKIVLQKKINVNNKNMEGISLAKKWANDKMLTKYQQGKFTY